MTTATVMRFTAIPLGLLATLALLLVMATLVQTDYVFTEPEASVDIGKIVMPEETITVIPRELTRPETPPVPPETPIVETKPQIETTKPEVFVFTPPVMTKTTLDLNGPLAGDYLPIVKVAPQYPRTALQRGLEGEVVVAFTVTRSGATRDVTVLRAATLDGTPTRVFDKAAIKAAEGFKYKPRVENGTPQEVYGVQNRFIFELAK
ncbi:energy transducer TonB [Gilvimarinus polysaccharolyticus]|uniref:energy transducer TonB n=1 Tax=Gilvimarinus polysaccharolyticus TaxID=863921 RepID=UPI0006736F21|nr:energy transducer TonB [Gilvimarinus polysaccharolyticus]